jgi:hypothetical protein
LIGFDGSYGTGCSTVVGVRGGVGDVPPPPFEPPPPLEPPLPPPSVTGTVTVTTWPFTIVVTVTVLPLAAVFLAPAFAVVLVVSDAVEPDPPTASLPLAAVGPVPPTATPP